MEDLTKSLLNKDNYSNSIILFSTTNIKSIYAIKLLSSPRFKFTQSISIIMHGLMILLAGIFYLPGMIEDYYGEYLGGYYFGLSAIFLFYASYVEYKTIENSVNNDIDIYPSTIHKR